MSEQPIEQSNAVAAPQQAPIEADAAVGAPRAYGKRLGAALLTLLTVLSCSALFVSHVGYRHMLDDQLQYLLLPFRQMDPHFAPGDWLTWQTTHYHQTFALIIRSLHRIAGERHFDRALFIGYGLSVAFTAFGAVRMGQALNAGRFGGMWAFLVMTWVSHLGPAATVLSHKQLLPADLALGALLLALASFLRGRALESGLWLGLSAFLHANFAILGALLLGCSLIALRPTKSQLLREATPMAAGYLLPAAPNLWLIIHSFLYEDPAAGDVDAILRVRSPHHYELSAMGPTEWYYPLCLLLCSLPFVLRRLPGLALETHRRARSLLLSLLVLIAIGTVFTGLQVGLITRLFLFRLAIPLMVLCLVMMAAEMRRQWPRPGVTGLLWLLCCLAALGPFARSDVSLAIDFGLGPAWFGVPLLLSLLLAAAGHLRKHLSLVLAGLLSAGLVAQQAAAAPPRRHEYIGALRKPQFGGPRIGSFIFSIDDPRTGFTGLIAGVRKYTPHDARLLIPPGMLNMRLHGRRAVFVDAKGTPMVGHESLEWKRRMLATMGTPDFPASGYALRGVADRLYALRPLSEHERLARAEGLTHIISRQRGVSRTLRYLFSAQGHHVYEVRPQR